MRMPASPERIASVLADVARDVQAGLTTPQACRKAGVGLTTFYRWRAAADDPESNEQVRIHELEREVGRLKELVAELALDRRMLQEALKKKP